MSSDTFPRGYLVENPSGSFTKAGSYIVHAPASGVPKLNGYAVEAVLGSASRINHYVPLVNPSSIMGTRSFVSHRHDVAVLANRGYAVLRTQYPPYGELDLQYPFCEKQFPPSVSYGTSGGPGFKTSLFTVDSGIANAHSEWDRLRARYSVELDMVPEADIHEVENFFYGMRGMGVGFRFKDWNDYQIVNQNVLIGDGTSTAFQLFKRYRSGAEYYDRIIRKPVRQENMDFYLDDVLLTETREFYINYATGVITFVEPPAAGAVGYLPYIEFDIPVRFDTDVLEVSAEDFNQYSISGLELIEILV
ncbi:minor tail protein [Ruegeria phage RpAliso]|nr:minor tail protein [Ruegeria phage RpAliso]